MTQPSFRYQRTHGSTFSNGRFGDANQLMKKATYPTTRIAEPPPREFHDTLDDFLESLRRRIVAGVLEFVETEQIFTKPVEIQFRLERDLSVTANWIDETTGETFAETVERSCIIEVIQGPLRATPFCSFYHVIPDENGPYLGYRTKKATPTYCYPITAIATEAARILVEEGFTRFRIVPFSQSELAMALNDDYYAMRTKARLAHWLIRKKSRHLGRYLSHAGLIDAEKHLGEDFVAAIGGTEVFQELCTKRAALFLQQKLARKKAT